MDTSSGKNVECMWDESIGKEAQYMALLLGAGEGLVDQKDTTYHQRRCTRCDCEVRLAKARKEILQLRENNLELMESKTELTLTIEQYVTDMSERISNHHSVRRQEREKIQKSEEMVRQLTMEMKKMSIQNQLEMERMKNINKSNHDSQLEDLRRSNELERSHVHRELQLRSLELRQHEVEASEMREDIIHCLKLQVGNLQHHLSSSAEELYSTKLLAEQQANTIDELLDKTTQDNCRSSGEHDQEKIIRERLPKYRRRRQRRQKHLIVGFQSESESSVSVDMKEVTNYYQRQDSINTVTQQGTTEGLPDMYFTAG